MNQLPGELPLDRKRQHELTSADEASSAAGIQLQRRRQQRQRQALRFASNCSRRPQRQRGERLEQPDVQHRPDERRSKGTNWREVSASSKKDLQSCVVVVAIVVAAQFDSTYLPAFRRVANLHQPNLITTMKVNIQRSAIVFK